MNSDEALLNWIRMLDILYVLYAPRHNISGFDILWITVLDNSALEMHWANHRFREPSSARVVSPARYAGCPPGFDPLGSHSGASPYENYIYILSGGNRASPTVFFQKSHIHEHTQFLKLFAGHWHLLVYSVILASIPCHNISSGVLVEFASWVQNARLYFKKQTNYILVSGSFLCKWRLFYA